MPEPTIGTQSVSSDFDASKFTGTPVDQIDASVLESMAAKSGQSVEDLKKSLNLVDTRNNPDAASQASDTLLAGKFKSEGDLQVGLDNITTKLGVEKDQADKIIEALGPEEAYKHFESKLGGSKKADGEAQQAAGEDALATEDTTEDALSTDETTDNKEGDDGQDTTETKDEPLDFNQFADEFLETGELSQETRDKITKVIPEQFLNQYLQGVEASQVLMANTVHEIVGGEDNWDTLVDWAQTNLTDAEKVKFNTAINMGNIEAGSNMAKALVARFEKAEGSLTRTRVDGSDLTASAVSGYQSVAEMTKDMKDPRYKAGDKAFHAQVQRKMANAKFSM